MPSGQHTVKPAKARAPGAFQLHRPQPQQRKNILTTISCVFKKRFRIFIQDQSKNIDQSTASSLTNGCGFEI
jgi:hypothetical protein